MYNYAQLPLMVHVKPTMSTLYLFVRSYIQSPRATIQCLQDDGREQVEDGVLFSWKRVIHRPKRQ